VSAWPGIVRTLKATVRALYSAVEVVGVEEDTLIVNAPSEMHRKKCIELQDSVKAALTAAAGRSVGLEIRVQASRAVSNAVTQKQRSNNPPVGAHAVDVGAGDDADNELDGDDVGPVESVVDQIAKSFPGARIVDSSKK